jgi:nitrate reductase NapE component
MLSANFLHSTLESDFMSDATVMLWIFPVLLVALIGFRLDSVFLRRTAGAYGRDLPFFGKTQSSNRRRFVVLNLLLLSVFTIGSLTIR